MKTENLVSTCHYSRLTEEESKCHLLGEIEDASLFIRQTHSGCYLPTFSKCLSWQEDEKELAFGSIKEISYDQWLITAGSSEKRLWAAFCKGLSN